MLQVGIGSQRHLVDCEFAGVCAAYRDEIDQCGGFVDIIGVDLGSDGNILVGALPQETPDPAGHAVDFRLQGVGNVGSDRRQLLAPRGIVAKIQFGPQAAHAVMQALELLGDVVEMAALDIRSQAGGEEAQIVQGYGDGDAIGRSGNTDFIVGSGHLDGEPDDLPRRGQPLHDQRQRERQRLRRLQGGNVERGGY